MLDLLTKICGGKGTLGDLDFLEQMAQQVKVGSLCALGGTAPNPVFTALKYFHDEFEEHVVDKRCRAGICTALVIYANRLRGLHWVPSLRARLPDRCYHRGEKGTTLHRQQTLYQVRCLL